LRILAFDSSHSGLFLYCFVLVQILWYLRSQSLWYLRTVLFPFLPYCPQLVTLMALCRWQMCTRQQVPCVQPISGVDHLSPHLWTVWIPLAQTYRTSFYRVRYCVLICEQNESQGPKAIGTTHFGMFFISIPSL
jgi:hypothetical protein